MTLYWLSLRYEDLKGRQPESIARESISSTRDATSAAGTVSRCTRTAASARSFGGSAARTLACPPEAAPPG